MAFWIRLVISAIALSGIAAGAHAEDVPDASSDVPTTRDIAADAVLALKQRVPLLLVFAQYHCVYCEKLDREVLNPYYRTGAFDGKAIVRRVMIDSYTTVTDFDGTRIATSDLAGRYKISVTPTLLFVDALGHELVERTVGINGTDFFNAYLDQSIDAAREKIRAR
jgi:thioredoxin-related protein